MRNSRWHVSMCQYLIECNMLIGKKVQNPRLYGFILGFDSIYDILIAYSSWRHHYFYPRYISLFPLLVFEAIFETRGVLMEKETEFGMYSKQWFDITDYEVFSGSKQDRIFKSPMVYFNSKLPFFKKSSSSLYKYKSLNENLSQVHLMCVVKCWIIFCSN